MQMKVFCEEKFEFTLKKIEIQCWQICTSFGEFIWSCRTSVFLPLKLLKTVRIRLGWGIGCRMWSVFLKKHHRMTGTDICE